MFESDKQIQKGGDASQQIQAGSINIYGITEKRAREIFDEKFSLQKQDYTQEAIEQAQRRVKKLENRLIPKIKEIEHGLATFSDPGFQFLLVEAEKAAASSDKDMDYDLLSELIVERVKKGSQNRNTTTGIKLAVEIVGNISDEALVGLTVAHSVNSFFPVSGDVERGLDVLNYLFGKIMCSTLPVGEEWLDHLDILKAIRINTFSSLKKINEYYAEQLSGYVDVGIKRNSETYTKAVELLTSVSLIPNNLLVPHVFNTEYVRIPITNKVDIQKLKNIKEYNVFVSCTQEQKSVIEQIYNMYEKNDILLQQNKQLFIEEWDKRDKLNLLRKWWDSIKIGFSITSAGKVLAHANAQRCDNTLPSLV